MLEEFTNSGAPHFTGRFCNGTGVIYDDLGRTAGSQFAPPDKDHRMIGRILLQLPVEEKVTRAGHTDIAADEECVELQEGAGISKLGKVPRSVRPPGRPDTKKCGTDGSMRIEVLGDRGKEAEHFQVIVPEPRGGVLVQRATIGITEKSGTVSDLRGQFAAGTQGLVFGEGGKPAAESLAVGRRVEMKPLIDRNGTIPRRGIRSKHSGGTLPGW